VSADTLLFPTIMAFVNNNTNNINTGTI